MKNVITRSLTGIIYIGIIIGATLLGGWYFFALTMLFALLGINEFNRISDRHRLPIVLSLIDMAGAAVMLTAACLWAQNTICPALFAGYVLYLIIRAVAQLYVHVEDPFGQLANSFTGQVYVALPLALLDVVYFNLASPAVVMAMFVLIWLNDTGAFCVGSLIGRHKLFERISPKKSWEGFWGGMAFCIGAGVLMYYVFGTYYPDMSLPALAGFGVTVSAFATWGDLIESLIKRTLKIKDSGNLLPGHGGILDRIDSLLLVVPATVCYFILLNCL